MSAIRGALPRVVAHDSLTRQEAACVMQEVMTGEVPPVLVAAFLTALRTKGETPLEVAGMADAMIAGACRVPGEFGELLDTCGTGGDRSGTFNISTAAAFVAAAAGALVAKHGNRSATSRSGGADVLEALGCKIELGPDEAARCLERVGITFLLAPLYHPAMRHVGALRRELGFPTVFNLLGPLSNPMRPSHQVVGVFSAQLQPLVASTLAALGTSHALVVHGHGGLDELALSGPSVVIEVRDRNVTNYDVSPGDVGLSEAAANALLGGDARKNAEIITAILAGELLGPVTDVVAFNAAAALVASGKAQSLKEAVPLAMDLIVSGAALSKLHALVRESNRGSTPRV